METEKKDVGDGYVKVNAFPAKRFFVEMLTRDIELIDAILDLIDNCLDGAMRRTEQDIASSANPYEGYWAKIDFDGSNFRIEDNCGGIPRDIAINSAFRMGRPNNTRDKELPTVGVYGIGMKRAIFKLGAEAKISSVNGDDHFSVSIDKSWMDDDLSWDLPFVDLAKDDSVCEGTIISVTQLREGISRMLSDSVNFLAELRDVISTHFSFIILKGFKIQVNGKPIEPTINFLNIGPDFYEKDEAIAPYLYKNTINDVDINLAVGFYRSLPDDDEEQYLKEGRSETRKAGWTIVCNDRVVVHADKTKITGWGEAGVPQYHTQFISISGTVFFYSNNPSKLPLTTTKRGIDGNSDIYLTVKEYMRDGLKTFTSYTNKIKSSGKAYSSFMSDKVVESKTGTSIIDSLPKDKWISSRKSSGGMVFRPKLPMPPAEIETRRIQFTRSLEDIQLLSEFFFDDVDRSAALVGEKCFDEALKRAKS
ncbi:ATP-binding protein [Aeromonas caviae]|uniref:ATPase n=1 Tax=Aeromonas caviae TaxID=648 RepID=A0A6S4T7H3_AERCA|nr:ATP-binding protein [Aeromonas caviae]EIS3741200.1 ATP-binding protein [Aeromonas hydrophila]EIS3742135.1 ATP-binding protein [Aeromonas hydrophila]BBQ31074.1 ATPase [Aeromonas caviae]